MTCMEPNDREELLWFPLSTYLFDVTQCTGNKLLETVPKSNAWPEVYFLYKEALIFFTYVPFFNTFLPIL